MYTNKNNQHQKICSISDCTNEVPIGNANCCEQHLFLNRQRLRRRQVRTEKKIQAENKRLINITEQDKFKNMCPHEQLELLATEDLQLTQWLRKYLDTLQQWCDSFITIDQRWLPRYGRYMRLYTKHTPPIQPTSMGIFVT